MELPFAENPFARKPTPSSNVNATRAPSPPPVVQKAPPQQQRHKKRNHQITVTDAFRGDANKKGKSSTVGNPSTSYLIFGDLTNDNFKDEDVASWSKRGKVYAGFCLNKPRVSHSSMGSTS